MYLKRNQLDVYLHKGKAIEQWIGKAKVEGYVTLKWIAVEFDNNNGYNVYYHEVFDEFDEGVDSIYNFSYVEPDDIYGVSIKKFKDLDLALKYLDENFGLKDNLFVLEGGIDYEQESRSR